MKEYNRLQKFIIGFLVFYFVAGLSTEYFLKGREKDIPMLFSWFLFIHTPNEKWSSRPAIRIIEQNSVIFDPPVFLDEAYGIIDNPNSPKLRELVRKISSSFVSGSTGENERLIRILEQVYLPAAPVRYELVIATYNPIERFKSGEYESIRKLKEFTKK
jgi:hypothetical protein